MITLFVDNCRSLLAGKIRPPSIPGAAANGFSRISGIFGLPCHDRTDKEQSTLGVLAEEIPALVEALRRITAGAEDDFLKLGDELQTVYSRTSALASQIVGAIRIVESKDGSGMLHELQALVRESLNNLVGCREEVAGKQGVLGMIAADVAGLDRHCSGAERMATYLTMIGFNIRIESVQQEEFDKQFGIISGDIRKFSGRIVEIIGSIREDATGLCREQSRASAKIATDLIELGSLADKADQLVRQAFGQIEELIILAYGELGRAGEQSTALNRQVGEIVMGIQLHDSMNQRIGHVIEALQDVERMAQEETVEWPAGMLDILKVQQAQVQCLVTEVLEVYGRTQEAFESIGSCVDGLTGSLGGFSEQRDSKAGDPFDQLTRAFLQLDTLLGSGASLIANIDELSEKTAASSGKLSMHLEQIQNISFQTRLIGLNSIVNAARLGKQGRIFEVLSNQLTGMTEYSDAFVGAVERIVGSIRVHIEKTLQQRADGCTEGGGRDLSIGEVVKNSAKQYSRFQEMSVAAGTMAETVNEDLFRIQGELAFLDRLRQELMELSDRFGVMVQRLDSRAGCGQKSGEQYSNELAARYTMQQERDIHNNLLSLAPTVSKEKTEDEPPEDVVLFFDEEPEAAATEEVTEAGVKSGAATGEDEKNRFNDNVELF